MASIPLIKKHFGIDHTPVIAAALGPQLFFPVWFLQRPCTKYRCRIRRPYPGAGLDYEEILALFSASIAVVILFISVMVLLQYPYPLSHHPTVHDGARRAPTEGAD